MASLQGCDLSTDSLHGHLQSRRARIHQQIDRELRMRTGAENLYRWALAAQDTHPGLDPQESRAMFPESPVRQAHPGQGSAMVGAWSFGPRVSP